MIDVPFAHSFVSHLPGRCFCALDELPSLDPEQYRILTYAKHCDGDVGDLQMTFSYGEDHLGHIVKHDLIPGGRADAVTTENK